MCDKYELLCSHFSIVTTVLNLILNLKDRLLVHDESLAHDLADKNHASNCREKVFHTNKCKCMSLNVGIELPVCERNRHVFPCSISNPYLF